MMDSFKKIFLGKTRFQLAWVFAAILILGVRHYPSFLGSLICLLGALLRYWASGFVRKDSEIAIGGPYAQTRNPLYLGTLIMMVGAAFAVNMYGLAVVGLVLFGVNYHWVIRDEEEYLKENFKERYARYCSLVPRFVPAFFGPSIDQLLEVNPNREAFAFSKKLARENKGYEALVTFVALIAGLAVTVWLKNR